MWDLRPAAELKCVKNLCIGKNLAKETNIAPENKPSQKERIIFRAMLVSGGVHPDSKISVSHLQDPVEMWEGCYKQNDAPDNKKGRGASTD